jgi:hypothetical protein
MLALANGICHLLSTLTITRCDVTTIGLQSLYANRPNLVIQR